MKHLLAGALVVLLVLAGFLAMPAASAQRVGATVDRLIWFEQPNQAQAILDLAAGTMDVYMFNMRTAADIAAAKAHPDLWTVDTAGSINNLFVNPVPVNQTKEPNVGNPFAKREVREALNYIVDRDFVAREISGGGLFPHTTMEHRFNPEYGREAVFMSELDRKYSFNPSLGGQMITAALNADPANYSFDSGTGLWRFKGLPVTLKFVIRTEDIRRNIGDYVADQLEEVGFLVERLYRSGGGAFAIVYNGPPDTGAWHLYTEGWAATALTAWSDGDPDFFYCAGEGSNIWNFYSPEPALEDVCTRLLNAQYSSLAERQSLFRTASDLALKNSVRVWIASGATFAFSNRVTGMVYDLSGGPWAMLATRTARFNAAGGTLQVGQRLQFLSPWNPWQGFGWLYDALQAYAFTDVAVWPHPHTGLYMPIRATFTVNAPGPTAALAIDDDAQVWDNLTMGFKTVSAAATGKSSVTYTFTFGKWHDGSDFDMDDIRYELALVHRRADSAGDVHAADLDAALSGSILLKDQLRGFKVLNPTTLQVWYDYWHPDSTTIASLINPAFATTPWTASELALTTVMTGTKPCRISEVTAANDGVDALDLSKGPCLAAMDANLASVFQTHRPPALNTYITAAEAVTRWTALWAYRNATGHYYSSNGPFKLTLVDDVAVQTTMDRDTAYPIEANVYDAFLEPRIPSIAFAPAPTVLIGRPAQFSLTSRLLGGGAYDRVNMTYLLVNPSTGAILYQGTPSRVAEGSYLITLTGAQTDTLEPGAYDLRTITVGEEAAVPVISTVAFIAIPDVETIVEELRAEITSVRNALEQDLLEQQNLTKAAQDQVAGLQTLVLASLGLAVVAIVVAGFVVVKAMPKKPKEGMGKPPAEEEL